MRKWIGMITLAMLVVAPVLAGSYEKCDGDTQECLDHMAKKMSNSGWVGVDLDTDKATGGYRLEAVVEGSPAESSGLRAGDVVVAVNGVRAAEEDEGEAMWMAHKQAGPGQSVTWTVIRSGREKDISITLARMPADMLARYLGEHMMQHATPEMAEAQTAD